MKEMEKNKKDLRALEWGFGEEWNGELRHSKSTMSGVNCSCSFSTSHYAEM